MIVTLCTVCATLMQALDQTIANVALPHMQGSLSASRDQITWVLTSYVIAAAIMTAPVGWLAAQPRDFGLLLEDLSVPSADDVRGHYTVREALETHSARLFAEKASAAEKTEITALAAWLDKGYARGGKGKLTADEIYDLHQRHLRFHMRIVECTGCRALAHALENHHVLTLNWLLDTATDWLSCPPRFHASLAEGLCGGDPGEASEAMRRHLSYGREELLEKLEARLRHLEQMTA